TPPSPYYVPGPEHPYLPESVPEPVYLEFMPPEDEVFPAKEQLLPTAVSPTDESPGYIAGSDPEEDLRKTPLIIQPTEETMMMMMMDHVMMTMMMMMMMMMMLRRTRMRRRSVTPSNLGGSGILNIRGRYFIDQ
nr:hypothetical protein [Tanacetum cinerariifolium]